MGSLDVSRVLDGVPWQLREGLAECGDALGLHLEVTLLRHGGVPAKLGLHQKTPYEMVYLETHM